MSMTKILRWHTIYLSWFYLRFIVALQGYEDNVNVVRCRGIVTGILGQSRTCLEVEMLLDLCWSLLKSQVLNVLVVVNL